jgi:hypothetical protein
VAAVYLMALLNVMVVEVVALLNIFPLLLFPALLLLLLVQAVLLLALRLFNQTETLAQVRQALLS